MSRPSIVDNLLNVQVAAINAFALSAFAMRDYMSRNYSADSVATVSTAASLALLTLVPTVLYGAAKTVQAARAQEFNTAAKKVAAVAGGIEAAAFLTALSQVARMMYNSTELLTAENDSAKILVGAMTAGYMAWMVRGSAQTHSLREQAGKTAEKTASGASVAGSTLASAFVGLAALKSLGGVDAMSVAANALLEPKTAAKVAEWVGAGVGLAAATAFVASTLAQVVKTVQDARTSSIADPSGPMAARLLGTRTSDRSGAATPTGTLDVELGEGSSSPRPGSRASHHSV